ncbi:hypothetical protein [Candidatus Leptofilum sp.]|uniref:hypothetical protein n=1 Tax=Candidatus Leptofilum sp. TaxID=3241576 RepID=UPI003B5A7024
MNWGRPFHQMMGWFVIAASRIVCYALATPSPLIAVSRATFEHLTLPLPATTC